VKDKDKISKKDKKTWEDYIKNPKGIIDKEEVFSNFINKKRYKFDLHGFNYKDAKIKVEEIINFCSKNRVAEILLITGKGLHTKNEKNIYVSKDYSKLQYLIPNYIQSDENLSHKIININKADKADGGDGALLIKLKKS
tara:strand:+ start:16 stop:432 length:417 start_codon:yes stop_codon:yes gene_type:complete